MQRYVVFNNNVIYNLFTLENIFSRKNKAGLQQSVSGDY